MKNRSDKYTLILAGGGAKGAYQIGAWKAFREIGIEFNAVVGTSVGAINGVFYIQNDYDKAVSLWESITLEKIVSIPARFIKDGKWHFKLEDLNILNGFQKEILKNKGLDTAPLRSIITEIIDEDMIRKSGIDFGLVTYELNSLTPIEVFINEIPEGQLVDYVMASATLPGFKPTKINDRTYFDGGLHDNIPFSLAYARGYRRFVIVDISGLGVNRRPDIAGTELIYIKNSLDIGSILDFEKSNLMRSFKIGYLDTMRVFGKINGLNYFYRLNNRINNKLEKILFKKTVFNDYKIFFSKNGLEFNHMAAELEIRKLLPKGLRKHKNLPMVLMECSAEILKVEKACFYTHKDLINKIWNSFCNIENKNESDNDNSFMTFFKKIKKMSKKPDISILEYEMLLKNIFNENKESNIFAKALQNIFPNLLPAKVFYIILKNYF